MHKAFFERADLAKPLVFARFGQALFGVFGHGFNPAGLGRVDLQEAAFDARMFVHARGGVGAVTGAQGAADVAWSGRSFRHPVRLLRARPELAPTDVRFPDHLAGSGRNAESL
ncbi:hypothetical protein [Arthrobacter bambusae]|uniref:hypothetical protein n=1 Tax=Arthrobacter bambusae TaxID=1338426 RepID=UPI00277F4D08|nr:hypothetical protein [Arthrobacter bambusae]MDQ0241436.1 hypothetical protein [Arthrobacter bambusae]